MSRSDNYIGLNDRANKYITGENILDHYEIIVIEHLNGTREDSIRKPCFRNSVKQIPSGEKFHGMFDDFDNPSYDLYKYVHEDGNEYTEYVQSDPWSSGPCFFIALKDKYGNILNDTLWTDDEIDEFL